MKVESTEGGEGSTSLLFSFYHISVLLLHSLPLIVNVASPFPPSHLSVAPSFPPPSFYPCRAPGTGFGNNCVVSNHPWQRLGGGDWVLAYLHANAPLFSSSSSPELMPSCLCERSVIFLLTLLLPTATSSNMACAKN